MSSVYPINPTLDDFAAAREQFDWLVAQLQSEATGQLQHGEVEDFLDQEGTELLRRLLQGHLDRRARDETRLDAVVGADGVARRQVRSSCQRGLQTLFGEVTVTRAGYSARDGNSLFPLDAALNLPVDHYSEGLRRRVCGTAAICSFDTTRAEVDETTGGHVPKRQTETLVRDASQDFEAFYAEREAIRAQETSDPLVLSVDGKGVVMHRSGLRDATRRAAERADEGPHKTRLGSGEKRNRKRMATVATVYSVAPYERSAEQIMGAEERAGPAPRARDKRVWASLERDMSQVIDEQFAEALIRDPDHERPWIVLLDGAVTQLDFIEAAAERHGVDITVTVDFIHVLEYLWKAAYCFHAAGTPAAEAWVRERALRLLQGKSSDVAAGMRRSATWRGFSSKAREAVDTCADYLLTYRDYLRYDDNLRDGLPIASGVIEGACRHLVKDRMALTGARWGLPSAEAVLKLRSLRSSEDLDEYWPFHRQRALERNHVSNYADGQLPKAA
jgi:hypothetical protein